MKDMLDETIKRRGAGWSTKKESSRTDPGD
jgi:hypothetical protein